MAIRKLILGSNEAMQHEPSLEEPQAREVRAKERSARIKKRLEKFWEEEDLFPKGIDDSMGG
jgi:hypothetical protein